MSSLKHARKAQAALAAAPADTAAGAPMLNPTREEVALLRLVDEQGGLAGRNSAAEFVDLCSRSRCASVTCQLVSCAKSKSSPGTIMSHAVMQRMVVLIPDSYAAPPPKKKYSGTLRRATLLTVLRRTSKAKALDGWVVSGGLATLKQWLDEFVEVSGAVCCSLCPPPPPGSRSMPL